MQNEEITRLDQIKRFDPKLHPKFSPNLFAWMKARLRQGVPFSMYQMVESDRNILYIGMRNTHFTGTKLWGAMSTYAPSRSVGGYIVFDDTKRLPHWFDWYEQWGRCFIDPSHTHSFLDERWKEEGDSRTCLWCGKRQRLRRWQEVIEKQQWENER